MKSHSFALIALWAFSSLASASVMHLDISQDGDIALDLDTKQKKEESPKRSRTAKPVYGPRGTAHVLDEYDIDLDYETHRGFLVDDVLYPQCNYRINANHLQGFPKLREIQQHPICRASNGREPLS